MSKQFFSQTGERLLSRAGDGVNGQFLLFKQEGDDEVLWSSAEMESREAQERLIGACCKRQRTVVVHQGEKDSLLRGISDHRVGSALCSPVLDKFRALIGVLLLWSPEPEGLGKPQKFALERATREISPKMAALKLREDGRSLKSRLNPYDFLYHPLTPILAFSLLAFLTVWSFRPATKPAAPPVSPTAYEEGTPELVAVGFLTYLRQENYPEAWAKLSPTLQKSWNLNSFTKDMKRLAAQESFLARVKARQISRIVKTDRQTEIILFESGLKGDVGRWTWTFKENPDGWTLISIDGPLKRSDPAEKL